MSGHGHVFPRSDGIKARCGGPGICQACDRDLVLLLRRAGNVARSEVLRFAGLMERELAANDEKRGGNSWKGARPAALFVQLVGDVEKLHAAIVSGNPHKIAEQTADVANMAMMIADVTGGLD